MKKDFATGQKSHGWKVVPVLEAIEAKTSPEDDPFAIPVILARIIYPIIVCQDPRHPNKYIHVDGLGRLTEAKSRGQQRLRQSFICQ